MKNKGFVDIKDGTDEGFKGSTLEAKGCCRTFQLEMACGWLLSGYGWPRPARGGYRWPRHGYYCWTWPRWRGRESVGWHRCLAPKEGSAGLWLPYDGEDLWHEGRFLVKNDEKINGEKEKVELWS